jgi:hypothetical protein
MPFAPARLSVRAPRTARAPIHSAWPGWVAGAALVAVGLAGCGGGASTASDSPVVPAPVTPGVSALISGTVATGAAFVEGTVTAIDARGQVVGESAAVDASGRYQIVLAAGAVAPFRLVAVRRSAEGVVERWVGIAPAADLAQVNVTPITHLIAARLSANGDPLALDPATVTPAALSVSMADVQALVAPALAATGTSVMVDPIATPFTPDGTGYDRLLDTVRVSVTPAGAVSNIEVAFRVRLGDEAVPLPTVQLTQQTPVAEVAAQIATAATQVTPATVLPEGQSAAIEAFLRELTACYALPLPERVAGADSSTTAATGGPEAVIAPACRAVFHGGDPAAFVSNGARVGRDAQGTGAFSGLFRRGATGVVFSQGRYEFSRVNGDVVASYRSRDVSGGEIFDSFVLRADASGRLRLIGNQYAYPGGVVALHQAREFWGTDARGNSQQPYHYRSTGYAISVPNVTDGAGQSRLDRVEVTSPRGNRLTLRPSPGLSQLNLVYANGNTSSTSYVRLRSRYDNTALGEESPSRYDANLFFANPEWTDEQIAAIPQHSVWRIDYFVAGNTGSTPDAVQHYKTRARALTLEEMRQRPLARLTSTSLGDLANTAGLFGQLRLPEAGPLGPLAYEVPEGAMAPTSARIFGRMGTAEAINGLRFDDTVSMGSTARSVAVSCSTATAADHHCGAAGAFAPNAYLNGLQLWARDVDGREFARFYAFYRLAI